MKIKLTNIVLLMVCSFFMCGASFGATLTVTKTADTNDGVCNADCSLREAIAVANSTAANDTITFNIPTTDANCASSVCTITLGGTQLGINNAATAGTLLIQNTIGTAANLRISGNNTRRVFLVNAGAGLTLDSVTVMNGNASDGSGIYNDGTVNITNSTISNNSTNSTFAGGGGVFNNDGGTVNITNSTISNNSANSSDGGGGIFNRSTLIITNSTISNNSANFSLGGGGGIYNDIDGTINITNSTIANNNSADLVSGGGGGGGMPDNDGRLIITNSTIANNFTSDGIGGGGIFNFGTLIITNSTIGGNSTLDGFGGGIYSFGPVNITNSTIADNSANSSRGGGIYKNFGTFRVRNTIVSRNTASFDPNIPSGDITISDNNIIGNEANVRLSPLGFYGGATQTFALLSGSTAINTGNNCVLNQSCATFNAASNLTDDQRGASRVGQVDIGAFELNNTANNGTYVAALPNGTQNRSYNFVLVPNNGAFTYSITSGALPNGVNLTTNFAPNAVVELSGTPTQSGTFNFSVTASDGTNSVVTNYALQVLAPTAASVSVGGRVLTSAGGRGLSGAIVTLTEQNGTTRTTRTNPFGYYCFMEVEAGQTVIAAVTSKRHQFESQVLSVIADFSNLNFVPVQWAQTN